MSDRLPVLSGRELVDALEHAGFTQVRQRGDHVTLRHDDGRRATVPVHRELKRGTLGGIMRQAEITRDELQDLLEQRRGRGRGR